jgi:general stress protein 26
MDDLNKVISDYISKCHSCTIATVGLDGEPDASTVFFANSGLDIYFNTSKDSQKMKNIEDNQRVAITIKPGNSIIVKVTATKVYFINYAKGFRHRELLQFS